ncbi:hypothetical protein EV426DRAFT_612166 [Tirmania nivea]|nr:hypothetical protein EV426DRAFT_612166 [Tirmania nivea]
MSNPRNHTTSRQHLFHWCILYLLHSLTGIRLLLALAWLTMHTHEPSSNAKLTGKCQRVLYPLYHTAYFATKVTPLLSYYESMFLPWPGHYRLHLVTLPLGRHDVLPSSHTQA